jgi:hypothetical protein
VSTRAYPDDSRISRYYLDTGEPIRPGDTMYVDGHPATVVSVVLPGTEDDSWCPETGGLLVREGGALCLLPFGNHGYITKEPME